MIALGEAYSTARASGMRFRFMLGGRCNLQAYENSLLRRYADNGFRDGEITVLTRDGKRKTTIEKELERIRKWKR